MILMLFRARDGGRRRLWTWFEFMQMAWKNASSALTVIQAALGCSEWRNPLRFVQLIRASILSLFCVLAYHFLEGDAYMALARVVVWAIRWRDSAIIPSIEGCWVLMMRQRTALYLYVIPTKHPCANPLTHPFNPSIYPPFQSIISQILLSRQTSVAIFIITDDVWLSSVLFAVQKNYICCLYFWAEIPCLD